MEYSTQESIALWLSFLVSYILAGWVKKPHIDNVSCAPGDGYIIRNGFYYLVEDGKPYNSGDPRAG